MLLCCVRTSPLTMKTFKIETFVKLMYLQGIVLIIFWIFYLQQRNTFTFIILDLKVSGDCSEGQVKLLLQVFQNKIIMRKLIKINGILF